MDGWVNMNFINPSGRFPQEIALPAAANANNFINVQKYKMLKIYMLGNNIQEEWYTSNIYMQEYVITTIISQDFLRN